MDKKYQSKLNCRSALVALAIGLGAIGILDTPVIAAPTQESFKLAQVGVRSRITPPTPLNLRPRTHIPSPADRYRRYNRGYGRYGRDKPYYRDRYTHTHPRTHKKRRSRRGTVIIINPSNYRNYSNYNGYIGVIGR